MVAFNNHDDTSTNRQGLPGRHKGTYAIVIAISTLTFGVCGYVAGTLILFCSIPGLCGLVAAIGGFCYGIGAVNYDRRNQH